MYIYIYVYNKLNTERNENSKIYNSKFHVSTTIR